MPEGSEKSAPNVVLLYSMLQAVIEESTLELQEPEMQYML